MQSSTAEDALTAGFVPLVGLFALPSSTVITWLSLTSIPALVSSVLVTVACPSNSTHSLGNTSLTWDSTMASSKHYAVSPPIHQLCIKDAFDGLTSQEKLYAHHMARYVPRESFTKPSC
jgi:hypothetical protein